MNALQQFLQSASNEAAGTISGPVDLIGMGLRKLGVPVPKNALMSSDWMRQNGLMQDVPQSGASLAGQTFGLLSPVVAAAKAPQIARGLLTMGENAAAPRRLNPQTGAIAWHGSPHKFDQFDSSKIGTGEGAQAYGHGLYLAESPNVAKQYQEALSDFDLFVGGKPFNNADPMHRAAEAAKTARDGGHSIDDVVSRLSRSIADLQSRGKPWADELAAEQLGTLKALQSGAAPALDVQSKGSLYKVDLPDEKIARMLDWDRPLNEQSAAVQKLAKVKQRDFAAEEAMLAKAQALGVPPTSLPEYAQLEKLMDKAGKQSRITGRDLYERFGGSVSGAEKLRRAGIPGIRYLDGGSRSAGAGSSNFVVFPGEENALRILERNGKPIR